MPWQSAINAKSVELWQDVPLDWQSDVPQHLKDARVVHGLLRDALSPVERQLTERAAADLLEDLRRGEVSAQEVVAAFAYRAIAAHQWTKCLSENNFEDARNRARELDAHWRANKTCVGPLHGLPVSLMDRFHLANLDSACGFASWVSAKRTQSDEGTLVKVLRRLGAIVHCKTNVPMSMMLGETTNNIIGTTTNPHNRILGAGGACGGEGALISLRGSALGFGTDVAGSIRIPAAFCGTWALKCSENRLPFDGIATVLTGLPVGRGAIGLMANEPASLMSTLKVFLDTDLSRFDPEVLELPWRQDSLDAIRRRKGHPGMGDGRLVFGIMTNDGNVRPHPPIQRAVSLVTEVLRNCGHEVIEWHPPAHGPAVENLFRIFGSTSAREARRAINASGEPPIPQIEDWYYNQDIEPNSTADFWELCEERRKFCTQYKAYWNGVGDSTRSGRAVDGVILPVAPTLAVRPGEFYYYGYSAIANVLDYPSGVFPVTTGDRELDASQELLDPLNDLDRKVQASYRIDDIHGMPVGLQVMCPRLREEIVLGLMEAIAEALANVRWDEKS